MPISPMTGAAFSASLRRRIKGTSGWVRILVAMTPRTSAATKKPADSSRLWPGVEIIIQNDGNDPHREDENAENHRDRDRAGIDHAQQRGGNVAKSIDIAVHVHIDIRIRRRYRTNRKSIAPSNVTSQKTTTSPSRIGERQVAGQDRLFP